MNEMKFIILDAPWGLVHTESEHIGSGRPCLLFPDTNRDIHCPRIRCSLPQLGTVEKNGQTWTIYEMPGAGTTSEEGYAIEEYAYSVRGKQLHEKLPSMIVIGLPRPTISDDDIQPDEWQDAGIETMTMLDSHLEWINNLYDEVGRIKWNQGWEGHAEGIAVRRLSYALERWKESVQGDEPRSSLIVRLERDGNFRKALESVCSQPRKILSRQRTMMSISRIQEVDPACIRWLVRQPGISLAQKAGPRQEAMGIIRVENADTPENRVVRDLLLRACDACSLYIKENRRFVGHDRVWHIKRFRRELQQMLKESEVADARPLVGRAIPNYVLQYDPRYSLLWKIYLLLLRQQKQQDDVWRWRQRTWAEHVSMAFLASLKEFASIKCFDHADVLIRTEQINGCFIDPRCYIPAIPINRSGQSCWIDFIRREQLDKYPYTPNGLQELSPDFIIAIRIESSHKLLAVLGVWTILDYGLSESCDQIYLDSLQNSLKHHVDNIVNGLILRPLVPGEDKTVTLEQDSAILVALPIQFQSILEKIKNLMEVLLKIERPNYA